MPIGVLDTVGGDLPLPLGGGSAVGVAPSDVDVLVDRTPFWLAITKDTPYQRETAQYQKDQADQQAEAGEQSLAGWWTRSQMSFHFGAGLSYLDTATRPQPEDRLRYQTSRGVDVWTPGVVSRLNGTTLARAAAAGERVWVEPILGGGYVAARDSAVEVFDGATWTVRNYGSAFPVRAFCTDGANYYVATQDGVWSAPLSGTAAATKLYSLPGSVLPMCLGWSKQRLMLGLGAAVHILDTAGPALPAAKYTHPVSSWAWTAFAESPNGIVAAGYVGLQSAIYKFELATDTTNAPIVKPGVVLVTLPGGEQVRCMGAYLSSMLILGTSRGIRVCPFDSYYGTMSLGPLSVESDTAVTAVAGFDRYVYGGTTVNGESSLVRVDLSAPLDDQGHYAWAPDLVFPTGLWTEQPTSIGFLDTGLKVIGVTGRGAVTESTAPDASQPAWLQTARIRMGTVEDKSWAYATLRGDFSADRPLGVSVANPASDGAFTSVYVTTSSSERFGLHQQPSEWIALRFDFADGAELWSYQLQALPGGVRQRLIALPLRVADHETTRSGIGVGYPGWGRDRMNTVEHLDTIGAEFTLAAPALFPEAVTGVVERLSFAQTDDPGDTTPGTGGVLTLLVRTTA